MTKTELKNIVNNKNITHCYIKKGLYYKPDACGYTDFRVRAGIYTKCDAIKHYKHCDELTLIPIHNSSHNDLILEEVKDLLSRIIT